MATTQKPRKSKKVAATPRENGTPSQLIADGILGSYADLAPSVNRIMEADVSEFGRLHAITLFRDSLGVDGDPMRNPVNAIQAGLQFVAKSS
jgi:hypothetical protein